MNCYVCLTEIGCESRPALAICQRCGAGVCKVHLVESVVTPVVGLAGEKKSILICCRCSTSTMPSARQSVSGKHVKGRGENSRPSRWNWWGWLRRRRHSELPEPEEAVASAERFLKRKPDR